MSAHPLIVGLGGTTRIGSTTERALRIAMSRAEALGARTRLFTSTDLNPVSYTHLTLPTNREV